MLVFIVTLVFLFLLCPLPSSAYVEVSGTITSDTTWTSLDTIIVTGSVTVTDAARLTIQPGTIIMFRTGTALYVGGELMANGEKDNRILFTSSADTAGGSPAAGEWYGVCLQENSTGVLHFCDLRYAIYNVFADRASVELFSCVIENFSYRGFYMDGVFANPPITAMIENCEFRQSDPNLLGTGTGIYVYRSVNVTITECTVSDCYYGLYFYGQGVYIPHFQVSSSEVRDHAARGICAIAGG